MSWSKRFDEPIALPGGGRLATLREAAAYITQLPKSEHDTEEWQSAMHCLLHAADSGGPAVLARIGFLRAVNRNAVH